MISYFCIIPALQNHLNTHLQDKSANSEDQPHMVFNEGFAFPMPYPEHGKLALLDQS